VRYFDYETDEFLPHSNTWTEFFQKRRFFDYEKEARLVLSSEMVLNPDRPQPKSLIISRRHNLRPGFTLSEQGIFFAINIDHLIEDIYVSPKAPPWFAALVQDVASKYGLERSVKKSSLFDRPVY
jgi:hypothetical protein